MCRKQQVIGVPAVYRLQPVAAVNGQDGDDEQQYLQCYQAMRPTCVIGFLFLHSGDGIEAALRLLVVGYCCSADYQSLKYETAAVDCAEIYGGLLYGLHV